MVVELDKGMISRLKLSSLIAVWLLNNTQQGFLRLNPLHLHFFPVNLLKYCIIQVSIYVSVYFNLVVK